MGIYKILKDTLKKYEGDQDYSLVANCSTRINLGASYRYARELFEKEVNDVIKYDLLLDVDSKTLIRTNEDFQVRQITEYADTIYVVRLVRISVNIED